MGWDLSSEHKSLRLSRKEEPAKKTQKDEPARQEEIEKLRRMFPKEIVIITTGDILSSPVPVLSARHDLLNFHDSWDGIHYLHFQVWKPKLREWTKELVNFKKMNELIYILFFFKQCYNLYSHNLLKGKKGIGTKGHPSSKHSSANPRAVHLLTND